MIDYSMFTYPAVLIIMYVSTFFFSLQQEVKKELDRYVAPVSELEPCDANTLLEELPLEPDLVLEMSHLGRGVEYYDEEVC